ncbi:MAG: tetratricopeptide repeat protein [Pseudomonadota bacterium]
MLTDSLGNALTTADPRTAQAIADFVDGFLSYETKAINVLAAAEADASDCLANAYASFLWMFSEADGAEASAAPFARRADAARERASERERFAADAALSWSGGDLAGAERACLAGIEAFPRDLALLKLYQYLRFNEGDSPAMLRAAQRCYAHNRDVAYMHGMIAFAYEQCHELAAAEQAARDALAIKHKEPWAQHALAHVMLTQGRIEEGAAFLTSVRPTWTDLNSFMDTHLWWHLALFDLSLGRFDEVVRIYDEHVWAQEKDYSQDQVGAVSLLARMEFADIDVGDRWTDLAAYLVKRTRDTVNPFLSLQYLFGLARAGRREEAADLLDAIATAANNGGAWAEVGLPAAQALMAYADGAYAEAAEGLAAVLPRMYRAGGSHAQRDLFDLIRLEALIRAGEAEAESADRRMGRSTT